MKNHHFTFLIFGLFLIISSCNSAKNNPKPASEKQYSAQDAYNQLVLQADLHYSQKEWLQARDKYRKAQAIKPNEAYPADKLKEIEVILAHEKVRR